MLLAPDNERMGGATAVNRVCELAVVVALGALLLLAVRAVPATPTGPMQPSAGSSVPAAANVGGATAVSER